MESIVLDGRSVRVFTHGTGGPLVVFPTANFDGDSAEAVASMLNQTIPKDVNFTLLALVSNNWDGDYSPWPMTVGDRVFEGHGVVTLEWITGTLLPYARDHYEDDGRVFVAGYSLAGLFALWAFYETGTFDGVACCSGSLWFEGWFDYLLDRRCPSGTRVYLSLGGKEPGSGPDPIRTIGECYKRQKDLVSRDSVSLRYEMNRGGHFSDPDERVVKGVEFLLSDRG